MDNTFTEKEDVLFDSFSPSSRDNLAISLSKTWSDWATIFSLNCVFRKEKTKFREITIAISLLMIARMANNFIKEINIVSVMAASINFFSG
jgi:hypothetical protein